MAKKKKTKLSAETIGLLKDLGTNPETLAEFIKHPNAVMKGRKIPEAEQTYLRNTVALEVAKKMIISPEAVHVHW